MSEISKAKIKWIRALQQKKHRDAEHVFVAEGEKIVLEGLREIPAKLVCLVVLSGYDASSLDFPFLTASASEMEQVSSLKTPNKLLAVFERPDLPELPASGYVALDSIQDPGNMGTILRLADWFGIPAIVCSNGTVDCFNPKVVQSTMGAIFRIPVYYTDLEQTLAGKKVFGALLSGEPYRKAGMSSEGILLLGNEGNGISEELLPFVTNAVTIPGTGKAESLNVATAAAILVAEMFG